MQTHQEIKYLEKYNMCEEEKIKLIMNLYKLAHMNYNNFIENN